MLLTQLMIKHDENKYSEYLTKVEKVKFEMGTLYRMHPSNYVKRVDFSSHNHHLHFYYKLDNKKTINIDDIEWNEDWQSSKRDWAIAQNGNVGYE